MSDPTEATAVAAAQNLQSLYKYVNLQGLWRILDGAIRFTQPSAFNDPFELLPEIIMPNDAPERQINVSFDLLAVRRRVTEGTSEGIPDGCGCNDALSRDIVQQLNQLIGVFSLSRVRDSLLMWSHYGDQYAGAVIEFDGSHEFFAGQIDIDYRSARPRRHVDAYLSDVPIPLAERAPSPINGPMSEKSGSSANWRTASLRGKTSADFLYSFSRFPTALSSP